ncbi:MAG: SpaA isopeptide-forming pilin-related protein [Blautia marasmi]
MKNPKELAGKDHNFYFGMRYDVTFQIGDYVGPLNYSFTGDDDLWVVLDGEKVVIDLGGIHGAAFGEVDLWDVIGDPETLTSEEKQKEHTLTILYMERGASLSNCQMNFTLPSARISEVTEVPMTNLYLNKVNKKGEALEGAKFKLVNDATDETLTASSMTNGAVQFTKLREGEYTLTETQAPNGYIPSVDIWKVKVTLNEEGRAVANVYLSDGETEAKVDPDEDGIYKILNVTEQELIDSSMNYDKTATVRDWDERTYDINITASSKLTSTTTQEEGGVADIMMVLDKSGSMNYVYGSKNTPGFVRVKKLIVQASILQ